MMNICNDGCPQVVTGDCVTYTGPQIDNPVILPNNTFNQIVGILVNSASSHLPLVSSLGVNLADITSAYMNTTYPTTPILGVVILTNILDDAGRVQVVTRISTSNWMYQQAYKI